MWKSVSIMLPLLLMTSAIIVGCSGETNTLHTHADKEKEEADSITNEPLFIEDLNAIERTTVSVSQPANVVYEEHGTAKIFSGKMFLSSDLDAKSKSLAYQLLKDLLAEYPLQRSFRSVQEDWLIHPMYSISYSQTINGKRKRVFKVDMYGDFTLRPTIEIKHKLGGRAVRLKKSLTPKVYSFFAQSIASQHPETAKALWKIADRGDETGKGEKR